MNLPESLAFFYSVIYSFKCQISPQIKSSTIQIKFGIISIRFSIVSLFQIQSFFMNHGKFVQQSYKKHWIIKYWIIAPRENSELHSCEPLVTTGLSTNQYIMIFMSAFYECVCLKKLYLLYSADLLTLSSWPIALSACLKEAYSHTHSLRKAYHSLFVLGSTSGISAVGHLKHWNHTQNAQRVWKVWH